MLCDSIEKQNYQLGCLHMLITIYFSFLLVLQSNHFNLGFMCTQTKNLSNLTSQCLNISLYQWRDWNCGHILVDGVRSPLLKQLNVVLV